MNFKITSAGNNSTYGDLFFTLPTEKSMEAFSQEISKLCREKAEEIFGDKIFASKRLEEELAMMNKTNTAVYFALLKEVSDLSREEGYPIMLEGDVAGSFISFLLGISRINPLSAHYYCDSADCEYYCDGNAEVVHWGIDLADKECPICHGVMEKNGYNIAMELIWGAYEDTKEPNFALRIAEAIRPLIHRRLNKKYAFVDSDKNVYKQISMVGVELFDNIGRLKKITGKLPNTEKCKREVYLQVLKNMAESVVLDAKMFKKDGVLNDEEYEADISLAEELKNVTECNFYTLTKIYSYIHGYFGDTKTLENIHNSHFFTLKDELFNALKSFGIPAETAIKLTKFGFGKNEKKRKEYDSICESFDIPQSVRKCIFTNLWSAAVCISRLQLMCDLAWYQINYPNDYKNTVG